MSDLGSHRPARSQRVVLGLATIALVIVGLNLVPSNPEIPASSELPSDTDSKVVQAPPPEPQVSDYSIRSAYREAGMKVPTSVKPSAFESVFSAPTDPWARHDWEMMHLARLRTLTAEEIVVEGGLFGRVVDEDDRKAYEHHRQKLVESGHLVHLKFKFKNLLEPSKESNHFLKLFFKGECPEFLDLSSQYYHPMHLVDLEIWCAPALVPKWERFVAEHDRSNLDYNLRFMAFNKDSESE